MATHTWDDEINRNDIKKSLLKKIDREFNDWKIGDGANAVIDSITYWEAGIMVNGVTEIANYLKCEFDGEDEITIGNYPLADIEV